MSRGFERGVVFGDDRDGEHFLELLEEMVTRYGVKVHAYVLLLNHYHLLLQTPHANQSRAMQWLNVSYGVWFNRRHDRVGPLFQGRFKSVPIDGEGAWALQASVYLHLNPVRLKGLGLGKGQRKAEGLGLVPPTPELVQARLDTLRAHRWSSYPAYAGYRSPPAWLTCGELWRRAQRPDRTATASYRWQVEEPLKGGCEETDAFADQVRGALALGSTAFVDRLRRGIRGNRREQPGVRAWQRLLTFERVIEVVEAEKGEAWECFRDRHGDTGRDIALWLGRRHCGLTQAELGQRAGGMAYPAVGHAVRSMDRKRQSDRALTRQLSRLERQLVDIAT
jgi:hypothetical protein